MRGIASAQDQILTAAQMRAAEQALLDKGTSADELMRVAGQGAAQWVWRMAAGRDVTVLCGPGNNGGDGYVIAEWLRVKGLQVNIVAPVAPQTATAKNARAQCKAHIASSIETSAAVFVDCLFGSGLSRPLSEEHSELLQSLAAKASLRIAIGVPSGIVGDDGQMLNDNLPCYDFTLALGAWKYAHWLMPAMANMGERRCVAIGIEDIPESARLLQRPKLYAPQMDAHKYSRGLAVIVTGVMPGAAILAATSAMRAGAGYVKLDAPAPPHGMPVDMVCEQGTTQDRRVSAILIGSGLGRESSAIDTLDSVLSEDRPTVIDADALHLLEEDMLPKTAPIIATPHAGELAALCQVFNATVDNKINTVKNLAAKTGMIIIAKGPDTIIAAPDGRIIIAAPAPSWLSIAGSGDVLAGIALSRLAAGSSSFDAACEAVWLHGDTAQRCAGPFTASELSEFIPEAYAACL